MYVWLQSPRPDHTKSRYYYQAAAIFTFPCIGRSQLDVRLLPPTCSTSFWTASFIADQTKHVTTVIHVLVKWWRVPQRIVVLPYELLAKQCTAPRRGRMVSTAEV